MKGRFTTREPKPKKQYIGSREAAERLGITINGFRDAVNQGRITLRPVGKYEFHVVKAEYKANTNPVRSAASKNQDTNAKRTKRFEKFERERAEKAIVPEKDFTKHIPRPEEYFEDDLDDNLEEDIEGDENDTEQEASDPGPPIKDGAVLDAASAALRHRLKDNHSLAEASRIQAWQKVRREQLETDIKNGVLVDFSEVNLFVSTMILRCKDLLERIAPEVSDKLAQESDPVQVEKVISREIRRALDELMLFQPAPKKSKAA